MVADRAQAIGELAGHLWRRCTCLRLTPSSCKNDGLGGSVVATSTGAVARNYMSKRAARERSKGHVVNVISLRDLTPQERKRLEARGKTWSNRFKDRKEAIRQSGQITRADLAISINTKS